MLIARSVDDLESCGKRKWGGGGNNRIPSAIETVRAHAGQGRVLQEFAYLSSAAGRHQESRAPGPWCRARAVCAHPGRRESLARWPAMRSRSCPLPDTEKIGERPRRITCLRVPADVAVGDLTLIQLRNCKSPIQLPRPPAIAWPFTCRARIPIRGTTGEQLTASQYTDSSAIPRVRNGRNLPRKTEACPNPAPGLFLSHPGPNIGPDATVPFACLVQQIWVVPASSSSTVKPGYQTSLSRDTQRAAEGSRGQQGTVCVGFLHLLGP